MAGRTFQIVAMIAVVAFVGTVTVVVMASGNSGGQQDGFIGHLHQLAQQLHGGSGHQDPIAKMVEQLNLTPDQLQRVERIHEVIGSYTSGGHESVVALHEELVTQLEGGQVSTAAAREAVDRHIEEMRVMAYAVTDGLVALANELDDTQRGILLEHLQDARVGDHGHGH